MSDKKIKSNGVRIFLKSMILTGAAIALIFIGYFSAYYFFGSI